MSNQVAVFNPAQLPAFARTSEISAVAKALTGGSGASGKRISVKGGVFRLIFDGKQVTSIEERHLDVVIVNAAPKVSRTYYAGTYDEANPAPPDCWSKDGDVPDPSIKKPQGANCANCPQNVAGSGQGQSRACRFNQRLAVVLANDPEGDVLQLSLAATSLFGKAEGDNRPLQEYARWCTAQGIDPTMLVTRMKFDTAAATPKLFFKPMRWLTDEEYAVTSKQGTSPDAIKAVTMTVTQMDGVTASAPAPFAGTPPKAAAKTEDEEPPAPPPAVGRKKANTAPVEDTPEPTVRKAAAAPAVNVPAAAGLAKTLEEWDD